VSPFYPFALPRPRAMHAIFTQPPQNVNRRGASERPFLFVSARFPPAIGVGAAVARAADGPDNISSSARVLAPRHGRDTKQPGEEEKETDGAPRAPQFPGWSEAVLTLRHPSPSQNCSFLSRVFSPTNTRLLPVSIWKSEKWVKLLIFIFEIRTVSASSRFSSCTPRPAYTSPRVGQSNGMRARPEARVHRSRVAAT
jgi:hypothetical protein